MVAEVQVVEETGSSLGYTVGHSLQNMQDHMEMESLVVGVVVGASLGEEVASSCSTENCTAVGHTLGCSWVHRALEVVVGVVAEVQRANVVAEALASMSSIQGYIAAEHMMASRKDRKASLLLNMLPHSIVDYKMAHMIEDSFVHIGCTVLLAGKLVVKADVLLLGNQGRNNGSHIQACKCGHIGGHKNQDVLVFWFSFCLVSLFLILQCEQR